MKPGLFLLLLTLSISACLTSQETIIEPTARPSPTVVTVGVSPYVRGVKESLATCGESLADQAILIQPLPDQTRANEFDLRISLGLFPDETVANAPLGIETLAVVVHPDHPLDEISLEELKAVFQGSIRFWQDIEGVPETFNREIHLWRYPPASDLRQYVQERILGGSEEQPIANLAPVPEAMVEAVAQDPGAIGILPSAWIDSSTKKISLQADQSDHVELPVLASSDLKDLSGTPLLACLQGSTGQRELERYYRPWEPPVE